MALGRVRLTDEGDGEPNAVSDLTDLQSAVAKVVLEFIHQRLCDLATVVERGVSGRDPRELPGTTHIEMTRRPEQVLSLVRPFLDPAV